MSLATDSLTPPLKAAALLVWDYLSPPPLPRDARADVILALGSNDVRVAERAAELFLEGRAPLLVFSGGVGALTAGVFNCPEAEAFARVAEARGVPRSAMLIEPRSTNTGENIRFSAALLAERAGAGAPPPARLILVQKPFMGRRTLATFEAQWPAGGAARPAFAVTAPLLALDDYPTPALTLRDVLCTALGDLQRVAIYPARGFQTPQHMPRSVWDAAKDLVRAGYVSAQLIPRAGTPAGCCDPAGYEGLDAEEPPLVAPPL